METTAAEATRIVYGVNDFELDLAGRRIRTVYTVLEQVLNIPREAQTFDAARKRSPSERALRPDALDALEMASFARGHDLVGLVHRSDRGGQYLARATACTSALLLNVDGPQSATVGRSGSVVLTFIAFSRGSVATLTHGSLGYTDL